MGFDFDQNEIINALFYPKVLKSFSPRWRDISIAFIHSKVFKDNSLSNIANPLSFSSIGIGLGSEVKLKIYLFSFLYMWFEFNMCTTHCMYL